MGAYYCLVCGENIPDGQEIYVEEEDAEYCPKCWAEMESSENKE